MGNHLVRRARQFSPFAVVVGVCACLSGPDPEAANTDESSSNEPVVAQSEQPLCLVGPAFPSCYGKCGFLDCSPIDPGACCSCDDGCTARGDCCCDYERHCVAPPPPPPPTACTGHCGGMAPEGCWCDGACAGAGDCCAGFEGECLDWPKVFPQAGGGRALALAADNPGNAYLAAQVLGGWDPGGGPIATTVNDSLVVSWTGLGAFRWAARLTSDGGTVAVRAMQVLGDRLYAVGQFTGSVLRREGVAILTRPGGAANQAFVLALNVGTGTLRWARFPPGFTTGVFNDVTTDSAGNPVMAGMLGAGIGVGRTASYDPFGVLRWVRPGGLTMPYSRLTLDTTGTSYVLGAAGDGQKITAYTPAGALRWSAAEIRNGVFNDVTTHTDRVVAVGACYADCRVDGDGIAAGALITDFQRSDGLHRLTYVHLRATRLTRVDMDRGGNPTMLGDYREGPVEVGGDAPIGGPGFAGVFSSTMTRGGVPFASQLVAQAALPARIEGRELALSVGLPRFALVESPAPIVVNGAAHDTTAPWNGLIVRLR